MLYNHSNPNIAQRDAFNACVFAVISTHYRINKKAASAQESSDIACTCFSAKLDMLSDGDQGFFLGFLGSMRLEHAHTASITRNGGDSALGSESLQPPRNSLQTNAAWQPRHSAGCPSPSRAHRGCCRRQPSSPTPLPPTAPVAAFRCRTRARDRPRRRRQSPAVAGTGSSPVGDGSRGSARAPRLLRVAFASLPPDEIADMLFNSAFRAGV